MEISKLNRSFPYSSSPESLLLNITSTSLSQGISLSKDVKDENNYKN